MQPGYFDDPDKKPIQFQPDVTQGVRIRVNYEYPEYCHITRSGEMGNGMAGGVTTTSRTGLISNMSTPIRRPTSEHLYDVPLLTPK